MSTPLAPGVYSEDELPMDAYHADRAAIGRSALKCLDEGVPADVRRYLDAPPREGTAAMAFGTAVQTCLRSKLDFTEQYIRTPTFSGPNADEEFKGSGSRARAEAWKGEHADKIQLPKADYDSVIEAAREIKRAPKAAQMLGHPELEHEVSFVWPEEQHGGRLVKCRPDFWVPSLGITADLKVDGRGDLSDRKLQNYVAEFYAHLQGAMCMRGVLANGHEFKGHVLIVVRRTAPVKCRVVVMTPGDEAPNWLESGEAQFDALLAEFVKHETLGEWADHGDQGTTLPVPAYVSSKLSGYQARLEQAQLSKEKEEAA